MTIRIDVLAAYKRSDGSFSRPAGASDGRADVYALVCKSEITYLEYGADCNITGRTEP